MNRSGLSFSLLLVTLTAALSVAACSSGDIAVGSSDQALKAGPNGGPEPIACTEEAKQCPDGSSVVRSGPKCEFAPCPEVACATDAMLCPDGSYVGRTGPACEFVCP